MKQGGLGARLTVALVGGPPVLVLTWLGGWWTAGMIAVIALQAQSEYYSLQRGLDRRPMRWLGLVLGLLVVVAWLLSPTRLGWVVVISFLVVSIAGLLVGRSHLDILTTFGGVCFPPLLAGSFILIRAWSGGDDLIQNEGRWLALCIWGALWVGDTAAYAGGSWFGRRPLAPRVSPHKTVEGFLIGLLFALMFCLLWWRLGLARLDTALAVGLAAGLFGQMGDLVESAIKREGRVKDAGRLLPGHGGLLDRFDSFFAAAPIVAVYLTICRYIT